MQAYVGSQAYAQLSFQLTLTCKWGLEPTDFISNSCFFSWLLKRLHSWEAHISVHLHKSRPFSLLWVSTSIRWTWVLLSMAACTKHAFETSDVKAGWRIQVRRLSAMITVIYTKGNFKICIYSCECNLLNVAHPLFLNWVLRVCVSKSSDF